MSFSSVFILILTNFYLAPEFHLVIQQGSSGEIYNLAIRGADIGGSDGVDVWGMISAKILETVCILKTFKGIITGFTTLKLQTGMSA